jgi:hypothetical protein
MTVAAITARVDLLGASHTVPPQATPPGIWLAVAAAIALLLGRALLWLLIQLLKFLLLLAIVGAIFAIGFAVGSHWDVAASHAEVIGPAVQR